MKQIHISMYEANLYRKMENTELFNSCFGIDRLSIDSFEKKNILPFHKKSEQPFKQK